jgi:hypothetical protein
VEFRIAGDFETMRHPFKDFTRKRAGRVGTRFHVVSGRSREGEVNYDGEMMLKDWQEKPGTGMTVTFWLDDEASLHPYAGCDRRKNSVPGEMFALVMVELDDDNQQQHQPKRHGRALSSDAHLMVTSEMFVQYLRETKPGLVKEWTPNAAKDYAKITLGVESLSELDHNPVKRDAFHEVIRRPYALWNGDR